METSHPSRRTGTAAAGRAAVGSDSPGCPARRSSLCPSAVASELVGGRGEDEGQSQQYGGKQLAARCWRQGEKSIFLIELHAVLLEKGSRQRGYRGVGTGAVRTWVGQDGAARGGENPPHPLPHKEVHPQAPTPLGRHSLACSCLLPCQRCLSSNQRPEHTPPLLQQC